jgi:ABC-type polysaccharide/polyol phosphate export permease
MSTLKLTSGGDYVYWLIPGILAQSAVFGSAPTAYGLNNDITKSVLDRSLHMARSAVLAGRTLPDLVRSTFILSLQLAVGILLGFRCHNGITGLLAAMAVALAFGYACSWLMAYIGLIIRNSEAIQAAIYMVAIPMTQTMPGWVQALAEHQPITIIANALRGLTLGQEALPTGHTIAGETPARPGLDRRNPRPVHPVGDTRLWTEQIATSCLCLCRCGCLRWVFRWASCPAASGW